MTNLPVGLTCQTVSESIQSSGSAVAHERLDDLADVVRGERIIEVLGGDDDRTSP